MKDDRAIVRSILAGDAESYAKLVERYYPAILGFLCKMGLPTKDSEELAEKVLVGAYSNLAFYDSRREFETWLYREAAASLRNYLKDRRRNLLITVNDIPEFLRAPNSEPDRTPEMESLNSLLAPLNTDTRTMLILHYGNRLPLREVGSIFGLSSDSVRMRLQRARAIILRGSDRDGGGMKCRYNEEFIVKLLSDDVEPVERQAFENHLKGCTECSGLIEADNGLIKRIRKDIPIDSVPVEAIMGRIDRNAFKDRKIGIREYFASMDNLMKLWRIAAPAVIAGLLIMMLAVPDIFRPVWGSLMSIFDKPEEPSGVVDEIPEPQSSSNPPVVFTQAPASASGSELVELLNARGTGDSSWRVLFANQSSIYIRNSNILVAYRDGAISMAADLEAINLSDTQGSAPIEFSFSPTGDFFLCGNSAGEETGTGSNAGVYLFDVRNGTYLKISDSGFGQTAFAWSPSGNYLAYSPKNEGASISILNLRTFRMSKSINHEPAIKSLFVSDNGGVAVFTGDLAMFASPDSGRWISETIQYDPFYIDYDSKSLWYVMNGAIMKHVTGSDTDTVIEPESQSSSRNGSEAYVTDCRVTGNHLVFRLKNGDVGLMNLGSAELKYLNADKEIKTDGLPWCDVTPQGARLMLDNGGKFVVLNGRDIVNVNIPGSTDITPDKTRWMDEEHIVYVRMVDEESPLTGEFSLYTISVLTGEISEIFRSVDKEPVLNTPEPGKSDSLSTRPSDSGGRSNEIHEIDKATGRRVESIVRNECTAKSGPGDNYADIGRISANEIVIYNNRIVNGWCLASKVSAMLDYYDMRNVFWIKAENILIYDRNSLPAGLVTADNVSLSRVKLKKGNLLRVIIREENRSYVIPEAMEATLGMTGWIDNASYTQDLSGAYFNQAYVKKGSAAYSRPDSGSDPAEDFMQHMTNASGDVFVDIGGEAENGFLYATLPGGISGWVSERDIYLVRGGGQPAPGPAGSDIDGDGADDAISFVTNGTDYTLTVNQCVAYGTGRGVRSEIRLVDIDTSDNIREIVIEESGDGGSSLFYHYDGENLVFMGRLPGLSGSSLSLRGDGVVLAKARGPVLETWFYWQEYRLNSQHGLTASSKLFFEKIGYRESAPLRLKIEELAFTYGSDDDSVAFILRKDEQVRFIGCDAGGWCLFENTEGKWGWLEVDGFDEIPLAGLPAGDVFEGLNQAG